MCNETHEDYGCEVTCVWDARRHPTVMIENVRRLHNHEVSLWGLEPSPDYVEPEEYLTGRSGLPLEVPPGVDWEVTVTRPEHFLGLRDDLRDWARRQGFKPSAAADVVVAVNEVATNGFLHGQPPIRVYAWHYARTLVIQVDDQGGTPIPAFAGYRPPQARQESEYGLWLARQLADVVQTYTDGPTTSVRLHFPYYLSHRNPFRLS